jgi:uncharacterized protein (DUF362 family)
MEIAALDVGLLPCRQYDRHAVKECVGAIAGALNFSVPAGSRVLLKPNLVSGRRADGLPCTHPEFIAAVAEWFLDQGARVTVGDSPAFGTAKGVMAACGITEALRNYPVMLRNFEDRVAVVLRSGLTVKIARAALECDFLVNLPKVKAHNQVLVTLAVKNYFGTVTGFRKAALHARLGDKGSLFAECLVDLLDVLPDGVSFVDGITAMHEQGPVSGSPFPLGLVGGAVNPVALDTALLQILGIAPESSPLWAECLRRQLPGCQEAQLRFPLGQPADFQGKGFQVPVRLTPISFHPWRLCVSAMKRAWERCAPKKSRSVPPCSRSGGR